MNLIEAKRFFAIVLDLNYKLPSDRVTFRKIMKVLDVDNQNLIYKGNVVEFFSLPNFLNVVVAGEIANKEQVIPRPKTLALDLLKKTSNFTAGDKNSLNSYDRTKTEADLNRSTSSDELKEGKNDLFEEEPERTQSLFSEIVSPEDQVSVPQWKQLL